MRTANAKQNPLKELMLTNVLGAARYSIRRPNPTPLPVELVGGSQVALNHML